MKSSSITSSGTETTTISSSSATMTHRERRRNRETLLVRNDNDADDDGNNDVVTATGDGSVITPGAIVISRTMIRRGSQSSLSSPNDHDGNDDDIIRDSSAYTSTGIPEPYLASAILVDTITQKRRRRRRYLLILGITITVVVIVVIAVSTTVAVVLTNDDDDDDDIDDNNNNDNNNINNINYDGPWIATLPLTEDTIAANYNRFDTVVIKAMEELVLSSESTSEASSDSPFLSTVTSIELPTTRNSKRNDVRQRQRSMIAGAGAGAGAGTAIVDASSSSFGRIGVLDNSITVQDIFECEETTQHAARVWLVSKHELQFFSDQRILQRYALSVFYYATGGRFVGEEFDNDNDAKALHWYKDQGWMDYTVHEREWFTSHWRENKAEDYEQRQTNYYYEADADDDTIYNLVLEDNNLKGSIPFEIGLLTNLEYINLANNNLYGTLPVQLSRLSNLNSLDVAGNSLGGGNNNQDVADFLLAFSRSLLHLNVEANQFQGRLPDVQYGTEYLNRLVELSIGFNPLLIGTIPTSVGQLTQLQELNILGNTGMRGPIPVEVCELATKTREPLVIYADCSKLIGCAAVQCIDENKYQDYEDYRENCGDECGRNV